MLSLVELFLWFVVWLVVFSLVGGVVAWRERARERARRSGRRMVWTSGNGYASGISCDRDGARR